MRRLLLAVLLLALSGTVFSQQRWERTYGGTNNDGGHSVQQTQDGGYIVAGWTRTFGNGYQVYLIKTNASGDTLWTRNYGGVGDDWGNSVQQTSDGGYIVTGETRSFGNNYQVYLIKTNTSGDTLWTKTYGGSGSDGGNSVQQTQDGGYIVAGYTYSFGNNCQVYLVKTNATGDTLWTRNYGGTGGFDYDLGYSVQQTSDGGYIVAGETLPLGDSAQVYLVKTNASGDTLWTRNYGEICDDYGESVQLTSDGGYVVAGVTISFGNWAVYLVKTDAYGDTLWTRAYGGGSPHHGRSVQQTSDGGYIIAGFTLSFGNNWLVYLVKTDASGNALWTRTYGGTGDNWGYSVQQTKDGGYIIAGATDSFGDSTQVYLIKTDANGNVGVEERPEARGQSLEVRIRPRPNPFTSFTSVLGHERDHFALYDVSGRRVGVYRGDRIGEGLRAGVYFVRPESWEGKPVRVVKVR